MQEVKKPYKQDLRANPAWSIKYQKIESNPGYFPGSRWWRARASSSGVKGSEILSSSGVGTFHRSDTFLFTSDEPGGLAVSRLVCPVLHAL